MSSLYFCLLSIDFHFSLLSISSLIFIIQNHPEPLVNWASEASAGAEKGRSTLILAARPVTFIQIQSLKLVFQSFPLHSFSSSLQNKWEFWNKIDFWRLTKAHGFWIKSKVNLEKTLPNSSNFSSKLFHITYMVLKGGQQALRCHLQQAWWASSRPSWGHARGTHHHRWSSRRCWWMRSWSWFSVWLPFRPWTPLSVRCHVWAPACLWAPLYQAQASWCVFLNYQSLGNFAGGHLQVAAQTKQLPSVRMQMPFPFNPLTVDGWFELVSAAVVLASVAGQWGSTHPSAIMCCCIYIEDCRCLRNQLPMA